ncbi:MAG TPA: SRPBCC domain-containing protein [Candidatus Baltobacteraceae bacterium]|nr:SRPBCC domain-containing protein [Candidatus Baltobacteraceae bacterium]
MKLTDVEVVRTISAPAEKVFDLWIDPKSPGGPWFGGERVIVNPVVDGLFYLAANHQGRIWPHYGRFLRLERPRLIEYTWMSEATQGAESIVTLTMEPRGEETEVTLHHAGVPDDDMGRKHKDGWAWILDMLAQGLAARRSASSQG